MIVRTSGTSEGSSATPDDVNGLQAPTARPQQPVLVISGMHRSGTSLVASLCHSAGLNLGERLMWPAESNPLGHFEDLDFFEFHERALAANGLCQTGFVAATDTIHVPEPLQTIARDLIAARSKLSQPWGWKDPRTVLFLDFWNSLLPDARWLFVIRDPSQVIDSLFRRGDAAFVDNPPFALKVWAHYSDLVRSFVRRNPNRCLIVDVSQVGHDQQSVIDAIRSRLGVSLSAPAAVYQPDLIASSTSARHVAIARAADPAAYELYADLRELAGLDKSIGDKAGLGSPLELTDAAFIDWAGLAVHEKAAKLASRAFQEQISSLTRSVDEKAMELAAGRQRVATLDTQIAEIRAELADRSRDAAAFQTDIADRERLLAERNASLAERDTTIASLTHDAESLQAAVHTAANDMAAVTVTHEQELQKLNEQIDSLQEVIAERAQLLAERNADVIERDDTIAGLVHESETLRADVHTALNDSASVAVNHEQALRELNEQNAALQEVIAEREQLLAERNADVIERDDAIASLAHAAELLQSEVYRTLNDRATAAASDEQELRELDEQNVQLQAVIAERDRLLAVRTADVVERDDTIASLIHDAESLKTDVQTALNDSVSAAEHYEQELRELNEQNAKLQAVLAERDRVLAARTGLLADRSATIASLVRDAATHRDTIASLGQAARGQDACVAELTQQLEQGAAQIRSLQQDIAHRARTLARLEVEYREQASRYKRVVQSNSWRLTAPIREVRRWITDPRRQFENAKTALFTGCRRLYDMLPISLATRMKHRRFLSSRFPRLLQASGSPAVSIPGLVRTAPPPAIAPILVSTRPRPQPLNGARHPVETVAPEQEWPHIVLPPSTAPVVSIIIPVHNQWAHTHACLQSIVRHEPDLAYEVILADDVSTDDTRYASRWVQNLIINRNAENLGFLRNCNAASLKARGEYFLLLNNDTEIQPHAITELLNVFRRHPDAGLVGSKLIYPDGRLQEAGGILWADGSAWNYGRGQNPLLPEFNYLRETDYCSGASIMVPRGLFAQLGGFDERYSPAYNEDSDLAFAVRDVGKKVYYQPASVVVHHEGVSHGTDVSQGVKARQVVNQQRFREKWHDVLERDHFPNAENVFRARDRSGSRKTILVIDHYVPQPDRDAGSRTMWCFLRLFVSMGMNVKFWPQNLYYDKDYTPALEQQGIEVYSGPQFLERFEAWAKEYGPQLDYVLLSRPHIAVEFVAALRRHSKAKLLYYGHDLHHARMLHEFQVKGDPALQKQAIAMRTLEESLWRQVSTVYYPSPEETTVVAQACPGTTAHTVPPYFFDEHREPTPGPNGRKGILFVAGFGHPPNVDAAEWLVREIMPLVHREIADAHLWLVGSNPTPAVQQLASDVITVTGYVSDERLNEFYRNARVAVVPLRFGAGVKSKVVEAMHHGLPLVTTPTGAQGVVGLDLILPVSDSPERLAQEIVAMIRDDRRWREVAKAGQRYVATHFSQAAMRAAFAQDIEPSQPVAVVAPLLHSSIVAP